MLQPNRTGGIQCNQLLPRLRPNPPPTTPTPNNPPPLNKFPASSAGHIPCLLLAQLLRPDRKGGIQVNQLCPILRLNVRPTAPTRNYPPSPKLTPAKRALVWTRRATASPAK